MRPEQKEPYKVYRAECPEYTGEGRPFATAEQESCSHCKPAVPGKPPSSDCGCCGWFYREQTPCDPIGVCICGARRRESKSVE